MSPADQPQAIDWRRSTDPPTLWLSLALGSVLLHLVFFIAISLVLTRTAKVQLEVEPIAVEFVDPKADVVQARSAAPSRTIASRPSAPSSITPFSTQAQPSAPRSQPFAFNQPIEQPFRLPQPVQQRRLPVKPQTLQPNPQTFNNPTQPQPTSPINSQPQQPNPQTFNNPTQPQPTSPINSQPRQPLPPDQPQGQPEAGNPSQGRLPGSANPPRNIVPRGSESQSPAEGEKITTLPQGSNVAVTVSNPRQTVDFQKRPPRPIELQKTVLIDYPPTLAKQTIVLQASLYLDQNGSMLKVVDTTLLSSSAIDQDTLSDIARQIFTQWRFEPAQDAPDGQPLKPSPSNLIINVQVQLP